MATRGQNPFTRRSPPQEGRRETQANTGPINTCPINTGPRQFARAGGSARRRAAAQADRWAFSALGSAVAFVLWIVLR